jgi:hypothetical protein
MLSNIGYHLDGVVCCVSDNTFIDYDSSDGGKGKTLLYVTHPNYRFGDCSKVTLLVNIARCYAKP